MGSTLDCGWGRAFGERTIVHVDMDAFFAQIEARDNPEYKGKPLIVGGLPGKHRGVVSTCSYEARRFGVHSAMPLARAVKLCPDAIFLETRMDHYESVSRDIHAVLTAFSPAVEPLSIDEAFLDMTGCEHFYRHAEHMGRELKNLIYEATGLTSSVGIAPNKFLAKLVSDVNKPDGLFVLQASQVDRFLLGLPVQSLWGVGPKMAQRLARMSIRTIRDLRRHGWDRLNNEFGDRTARHLWQLAHGHDERPVEATSKAKSIGRESTFEKDIPDGPELRSHLARLTAHVAWRLRREEMYARTVTVKVRFPDFATHTKSHTLARAFRDDDTLFAEASKLLTSFKLDKPLRLLGVYVSHFQEHVQEELFAEPADRLTDVIDNLNEKLGSRAVRRGREL